MKFILTIDLANAAFDHDEPPTQRVRDGNEIARILRCVARDVEGAALETSEGLGVYDDNGNHVGGWRTTTR